MATILGLADQPGLATAPAALIRQPHAYFSTQRGAMHHAAFAAAGSPIGSGCGASANKLLVEARLKRTGMHWRREHVNALSALATLEASGR